MNQDDIKDNILVMKSITKSFPGVKALDEVDIEVKRGEIHFIVGENGAGKSTLMKVLSGIYPYGNYDGDIIFDNHIKHFHGIKDSVKNGIVIINQELALFPNLTIYENIFLGDWIYMRSNYELFPELFANLSDDVTSSELEAFPNFATDVVTNSNGELYALPFGIGPTVTFVYTPLFNEPKFTVTLFSEE